MKANDLPQGIRLAAPHQPAFDAVLTPEALGVDVRPRLNVLAVNEPAKRQAGVKVANVAELLSKLKNEAKVI